MLNLLFCSFQHTILFLQLGIRLTNDGMLFKPDLIKGKCQRLQCLLPFRWFQFTLPNGNAMPTHLSQSFLRLNIPFLVPLDLRHPKIPPCIWYFTTIRIYCFVFNGNIVPMPKAPIHKDTSTIFLQYQIRMPRQRGELSLYRNPLLHNPFRTIISGFVSLPRIAAMFLCRCSAESLSISLQCFNQFIH